MSLLLHVMNLLTESYKNLMVFTKRLSVAKVS